MTMFIIIGVIALFLLYIIITYNNVKKGAVKVEQSFSNMDVLLQNRADEIVNLISTTKSAVENEKELLEEVTALRSQVNRNSNKNVEDKLADSQRLDGSVNTLLGRLEAYPDIKFTSQYNHLQNRITNIEENIQAQRRTFNARVADFNAYLVTFPRNIIATIFNFSQKPSFEVTDQSKKETPNVSAMFEE
ncbi:LemA family protein [Virgibacillus salinus]|uniref:LemA protein n=1 Tax=Virgibacillus salinus TaxID=553311 RepID=A0A1H1EME6_9BACI|nr:LemA family protein [Virgibacillus salinus]SDQ89872.1 LemA protein [Virgibacillus salinus]